MKKQKTRGVSCKVICIFVSLLLLTTGLSGLTACDTSRETVVIYTSVDQVYSEKLFREYEKQTGVRVRATYDIEADKTVGLVNKLISEKENPRADVFWNGEIIQTIVLKENGILSPASPSNASALPGGFVDEDSMWFGLGGRARVLIYNKTLISKADLPKTMEEFATGPYVSNSGFAYPIFGTTSTHAAVHYAHWGNTQAKLFYQTLKDNGVQILDGNSVVKDYVSQKKLFMGMTDTDDALLEMEKNADLDIFFLDQGEDDMGTLVIPNTVCKIKGGPNPDQAERFIEFLLSVEAEQMLVDDEWIQIPVHESVQAHPAVEEADVKIMAADFTNAYQYLEESKTDLTAIYIR
jgi:iron(III) transport system substrate-binding protein